MSPQPLESVQVSVQQIWRDEMFEPGKQVVIEQDTLKQAIQKLFTDKMINLNEQFPLALFNQKLILRVCVTRVETLKVDQVNATYGQFTADTAFKSETPKPLNKGAAPIKIQRNENEVKEIFNEDVSFQSLGIGGLDD